MASGRPYGAPRALDYHRPRSTVDRDGFNALGVWIFGLTRKQHQAPAGQYHRAVMRHFVAGSIEYSERARCAALWRDDPQCAPAAEDDAGLAPRERAGGVCPGRQDLPLLVRQVDACDEPRGQADRHAPAVGREHRAIGANGVWYFIRLRAIESANEDTAPAVSHAYHRHDPAVGRDARRENVARIGLHVAWEPDLEVRHRRGGGGGACPAPQCPCGNERQGRGGAPRHQTRERGRRGWLDSLWCVVRIVQCQSRLADIAQPPAGILDETPRYQRADACRRRGRQRRQIRFAREDQPKRFGDRVPPRRDALPVSIS